MKSTTAIFLVIVSLGLFLTFTRPTYEAAKALAVTSSGYRNVLDNISDIVESRDRLITNSNSLPKSEVERLSKALPENIDTVRLALDLDNMAAKYGIAIKDVKIDTETEQNASQAVLPGREKPFEKALVSVSFVSNYENFRKFLSDLEKSLRIMNVKEVHFQVGESGIYEHRILIETYWVK